MNWPSDVSVRLLAAAATRRHGLVFTVAMVLGVVAIESAVRWAVIDCAHGEASLLVYLPGIALAAACFGFGTGAATFALSTALWVVWRPSGGAPTSAAAWVHAVLWCIVAGFVLATVAAARRLIGEKAATAAALADSGRRLGVELEQHRRAEVDATVRRGELERLVAERTARLEETIADLETFSYTVSHDLRSPARAMQGFAEILLAEYGDKLDEQGRDYLRRIDRGAQRMDLLIREVLAYSRVSRMAMETRPVDLEQLIVETVRDTTPIKRFTADITIDRPLAPVLGSAPALGQAVGELLSNAAKFVPPGARPRVRIWTEEADSRVRLMIQDHGIGMPESALGNVFKPFHRAHPHDGYQGTGMGLAIVKRALERQGGTVGVRSGVGEGSVFWLELPAAPKAPHSPVP